MKIILAFVMLGMMALTACNDDDTAKFCEVYKQTVPPEFNASATYVNGICTIEVPNATYTYIINCRDLYQNHAEMIIKGRNESSLQEFLKASHGICTGSKAKS